MNESRARIAEELEEQYLEDEYGANGRIYENPERYKYVDELPERDFYEGDSPDY